MSFFIRRGANIDALQSSHLSAYEPTLVHGCFHRTGGVSPEPFLSLNTALSTGDDPKNVAENRRLVLAALGATSYRIIAPNLCHSDRVFILSDADEKVPAHLPVDAVVTGVQHVALLISTADCNPVFFFNRETGHIGLAHVGWRGLVSELPRKVVAAMAPKDGAEEIVAAVGPSIGPCCYRIREPAQLTMPAWKPYLTTDSEGLTAIDLWTMLEDQLELAGLHRQNVCVSRICTACNSDDFFSFWREKPLTGRFASVIALS